MFHHFREENSCDLNKPDDLDMQVFNFMDHGIRTLINPVKINEEDHYQKDDRKSFESDVNLEKTGIEGIKRPQARIVHYLAALSSISIEESSVSTRNIDDQQDDDVWRKVSLSITQDSIAAFGRLKNWKKR